MYLFQIDFSIGTHTSVADEVDDPFLAFVFGEVQSRRQITENTPSDHRDRIKKRNGKQDILTQYQSFDVSGNTPH